MEHNIDLENEVWAVWKDTRYNPNGHLYEVSDQGRAKVDGIIYDFETSNQKDWTYYRLGCHDLLHRAVAILHVPNQKHKPCVDHINGDSHDNRACNLRWVTQKENMNNPITRSRLEEYWNSDEFSVSITNRNLERWSSEENHKELSSKMKVYWDSEAGKQRKEKGFNYIHLGDKVKIVSDEYLDYWLDDGWVYGCRKHLSEESRNLLSESFKNRKFVNNGIENRYVKDEELNQLLDNGWVYGRLKKS